MPLAYLVAALLSLHPGLGQHRAEEHVQAAVDAAGAARVPVEVLLGIAHVESDFRPGALSWRQCRGGRCVRRTGVWTAPTPPPGARPTFYCGYLQVGGDVSWDVCRVYQTDMRLNYHTAAQHLKDWKGWSTFEPRCKRSSPDSDTRLRCALRGYNGGIWLVRQSTSWYANQVMRTAARIIFTARGLERAAQLKRRNI